MKRIIESLAEKEDGTIIFSYMRPNKNALIESIKELYGFCREQDVKIKLELYSDRPSEVAKSVHIKNPDVDINGVKFSINV
uniref:Ribonuclease P n=1 Tax=Strongyloides papillosus TaxID=174720 RepID=A0A0N5B5L0_STREA